MGSPSWGDAPPAAQDAICGAREPAGVSVVRPPGLAQLDAARAVNVANGKRRAGGEQVRFGVWRVMRALLSSRYPRTVPAIAASADVPRCSAYRALLTIELESGLPLTVTDAMGAYGRRVRMVGIDWDALRRMG